jgi:hypothetical protein
MDGSTVYNSFFGRVPGALSGENDAVGYVTVTNGTPALKVKFSSTGLAVTGTLSATSTFTVTNGGAQFDNGQAINMKNASGTMRQALVMSNTNYCEVGGTADAGVKLYYGAGNLGATLNSSGNLGLGVTPSAWAAGWVAQQIGYSYALMQNTSAAQFYLMNNAYYDGSFKYKNTAVAGSYEHGSSGHIFKDAASGTANNAITFTQVLAVQKDKSLALQGATSQTGTGITFPATQSACSDANTLDDYEEGTWTPTISFGGASVGVTYTMQVGKYTKIGNVVNYTCYVELSAKGSSTGYARIGGLPFTASSSEDTVTAALRPLLISFADFPMANIAVSGTSIRLEEVTNAGTASDITNSDFVDTSRISVTGHYHT